MLELIPASAIIAIVVIALIVIFLAVGYVKAPPDMIFFIINDLMLESYTFNLKDFLIFHPITDTHIFSVLSTDNKPTQKLPEIPQPELRARHR